MRASGSLRQQAAGDVQAGGSLPETQVQDQHVGSALPESAHHFVSTLGLADDPHAPLGEGCSKPLQDERVIVSEKHFDRSHRFLAMEEG